MNIKRAAILCLAIAACGGQTGPRHGIVRDVQISPTTGNAFIQFARSTRWQEVNTATFRHCRIGRWCDIDQEGSK